MNPELIAFAEGLVMGTVTNAKGGLLSFVYSEEWSGSPRAYPLSVAMPLAEEIYTDRKIRPFLWEQPHSSLGYRTPAEFAVRTEEGRGKDVRNRDLEIPAGFPLSHRPKQENRFGSEANVV